MNVLIPRSFATTPMGARTWKRAARRWLRCSPTSSELSGIRFRMIDEQDAIRRHIKIFVNQQQARDLGAALSANDEVVIVGALSGG